MGGISGRERVQNGGTVYSNFAKPFGYHCDHGTEVGLGVGVVSFMVIEAD